MADDDGIPSWSQRRSWKMELVIIFAKILFKKWEDGIGDNICKKYFSHSHLHHLWIHLCYPTCHNGIYCQRRYINIYSMVIEHPWCSTHSRQNCGKLWTLHVRGKFSYHNLLLNIHNHNALQLCGSSYQLASKLRCCKIVFFLPF